jgi:TPR repeat protein
MLITGLAMAGPSEDAKQAYDRGDYKTAYRLNKPLAERGSSVAQSNLGLMYYHSRGVSQDYAEAMKWFRKAADQGDADAQYSLGLMYAIGKGVPQDYVLAYMWLNLASTRDSAWEKEKRDKAKENRENLASKLTSAQVAEAQKLAREWKLKKEK